MFDCKKAFDEYPNAVPSLAVTPPVGDPYPAVCVRDGDLVYWDIVDSDVAYDGDGEGQITFTVGTIVKKTYKFKTKIEKSILPTGDAPSAIDDWITRANAALNGIPQTISDSIDETMGEISAEAETLEPGSSASASFDIENRTFTFGIPTGAKGDKGDPGESIKGDKGDKGDPGDPGDLIDDTAGAGDTNKTFSADKLTADHSNLLNAISAKPDIKDSTKTGVDLDVSDSQGNVILRIADGHIKTKNFDSETDRTGIIKNSTKTGVDLDFSDSQGNVVLRLKNGNICTKWFSSENADGSVDYNADVVYTNTDGTKAITADFHSGDEIVMHFSNASDRIAGLIKSDKVTYKYTDASNTDHTLGTAYGYDYPVYKLPDDATAISVTYGAGLLWGENGTLRFSVYKKGITERKPHLISVASDGSKDYTSVRDAIDSITDNNAYNKYRIEIYPGTYDIISYYTAEEIGQTGFQGLFVGDGVSLVGVGQKDNIILTGTLDTNVYSSTKRNDISVINIAGTASIENMTINAENMRYCIHDDTGPMTHQTAIKEIIDCVLNAKNMTTGAIAYGCGISNMRKLHLKNCIFNEELHIHTHDTGTYSPSVLIENCEARVFSFADYNSTVNIEYSIMNCKFSLIRSELVHTPHNQFLFINQIGGTNPIVDCETGMIYNLSNCIKAKGQIPAGQLVNVNRISRQMTATAVSSANIASGVSIGYTGSETVVASGGYINSNQVGLTGLSQGDFITIDSDGVLISGGTSSNAVGVVISISERQDGGAYIKLFV